MTKSLNGTRLDVSSVQFDAINLNIPMKIALSKSANAALWRNMPDHADVLFINDCVKQTITQLLLLLLTCFINRHIL